MQAILDRLNGIPHVHVPITYSSHEKKTAKNVLERLLARADIKREDITPVVPVHEED
tara:strand:+ start:18876 stop:19046 length:171 start_codon:yes stop_codon:yes gene_type:complete